MRALIAALCCLGLSGCAHGSAAPLRAGYAGTYTGAWPASPEVFFTPAELQLKDDGSFTVRAANAVTYPAGTYHHGAGWVDIEGSWTSLSGEVVLRWGVHRRPFAAVWSEGQAVLVPYRDHSWCRQIRHDSALQLRRRVESPPSGFVPTEEFCEGE